MIVDTNRVPGQLMPVGANWWCNAGQSLNALKPVSGLSGPLSVSGLGALAKSSKASLGVFGYNTPMLDFMLNAGMGYIVGRAMGQSSNADRSGMIGALTGGFFGLTGVAVQAAIQLGGLDHAKALHARHMKGK